MSAGRCWPEANRPPTTTASRAALPAGRCWRFSVTAQDLQELHRRRRCPLLRAIDEEHESLAPAAWPDPVARALRPRREFIGRITGRHLRAAAHQAQVRQSVLRMRDRGKLLRV